MIRSDQIRSEFSKKDYGPTYPSVKDAQIKERTTSVPVSS